MVGIAGSDHGKAMVQWLSQEMSVDHDFLQKALNALVRVYFIEEQYDLLLAPIREHACEVLGFIHKVVNIFFCNTRMHVQYSELVTQ